MSAITTIPLTRRYIIILSSTNPTDLPSIHSGARDLEALLIKDQTLVANPALISGKDGIIKTRENELQKEIDLVKSHGSTIAWQNRDIRELHAKINLKNKNMQDLTNKSNPKNLQSLQGIYDNQRKQIKMQRKRFGRETMRLRAFRGSLKFKRQFLVVTQLVCLRNWQKRRSKRRRGLKLNQS
ncbi:hypothetical protein N431DRAFT_526787 [Stipitochalara longipes BDJ]|nr:hypothetical protein N431DRAFT_526787 [Stipitochalara longipes BDJ]